MYKFIFSKYAKKQFDRVYESDKKRIITKLTFLKEISDIYDYIKPVRNLLPSTHRIRISNFRLLIKIENNNIIILKVWHRRDIYK